MSRHNRNPHPTRPSIMDRYDLDYVHLPQYPKYNKIAVKPLKTVFVNLDADFWTDEVYIVRNDDDPVFRALSQQIEAMA